MIWYFSSSLLEKIGWPQLSSNYPYYSDTIQALVFIAILFIISEIRGISWNLYGIFEIEEKYGFNKRTLNLFIKDYTKKFFLITVLLTPLLYLFLKVIEWGGPYFYLYLFAFTVVFFILFINVLPNFIMPLFNKYEELEEGELREKIESMAKKLNFPLTKIFKVDAS